MLKCVWWIWGNRNNNLVWQHSVSRLRYSTLAVSAFNHSQADFSGAFAMIGYLPVISSNRRKNATDGMMIICCLCFSLVRLGWRWKWCLHMSVSWPIHSLVTDWSSCVRDNELKCRTHMFCICTLLRTLIDVIQLHDGHEYAQTRCRCT